MEEWKEKQEPNILIVDDVSTNLVILSEMIKSLGYVSRPVISVKQAQAAIRKRKPQLILLDIAMPDIDGFEFCAMLKKNVETREIPIIFISALASVEDKMKGFKLGAVDFITKPFEKEEVTMRIKTHLKIYEMQQELAAYNHRLHKMMSGQVTRVQQQQTYVLQTMAEIAEEKKENYKVHLRNVGKISRLLALSLQFSPKFEQEITATFVDNIALASELHDIGMASVTDDIVLKKGTLSEEERGEMQKHTLVGRKQLEYLSKQCDDKELFQLARDIAGYHHEHWDGTGYPEGLRGEEIPLGARIVAIADVYDALTSERYYRDAYSHEESIEIMLEESGKQFDPDIMEIFSKIQNQIKNEE